VGGIRTPRRKVAQVADDAIAARASSCRYDPPKAAAHPGESQFSGAYTGLSLRWDGSGQKAIADPAPRSWPRAPWRCRSRSSRHDAGDHRVIRTAVTENLTVFEIAAPTFFDGATKRPRPPLLPPRGGRGSWGIVLNCETAGGPRPAAGVIRSTGGLELAGADGGRARSWIPPRVQPPLQPHHGRLCAGRTPFNANSR